MAHRWGNNGNSDRLYFLGLKITADADCSHEITPWKKSYDQPRLHIKKQRHYFDDKSLLVKAMVFLVVVYGCESWTIKKAEHWRIDAFELWCWRRLLRVPWTARRSNQCFLKEISPEYSLRTDAEAETPILWPPDVKNWLMWKDPDTGKDWRHEKGTTEDETAGWHHQLDRQEFEQALGVGDGQGSLVCCSPWGRKESDTTERLKRANKHRCISNQTHPLFRSPIFSSLWLAPSSPGMLKIESWVSS